MPKAIQNALTRLPKNLDAIYSEILQKIDDAKHDSVVRIFTWLMYAYKPLNLDQVADMLAIDLEEEKFNPEYRPLELQHGLHSIVDSTFVVIDSARGGNVVQFAHISVQEFLMSECSWAEAKNLFKFNKALGHEIITQCCIIYLLHLDSWESLNLKLYPLASYAAEYWVRHCNELPMIGDKIIQARRILFEEENPQYLNWLRLYKMDEDQYRQYWRPGLQLKDDMVNAQGGHYGTALQAAAVNGNKEIVECLLQAGANVNAQGGHYGTALQAGAAKGKKEIEIVECLLQAGADVNAQGGHYGTALWAGAALGYKEIVECLLQAGADVNAQGGEYGTALQAATHSPTLTTGRS
ncbi:hypothetical protein GYMLUDRAFT_167156 [Collybiopsis luxurians FD-317 M1]|uniref:GPI inositol-deacylase winged helix domain-containing protein n=1 Tax=Collybiopsis luxurians FD-317 M1 TaxID=944289 RepID=A0A0D0CX49_9AGAR|nr:hypothetical protein GYMLUDRAFT_167156 [Collybiopsis luxurians FD-317 M1]